MRSTEINARWKLWLPDHRADFHEARPWWEAARLADMYATLKPGQVLIDVGSEEGDLTALYATWGLTVPYIDPSKPWHLQTLETFAANRLNPTPAFIGFADDHNYIEGHAVAEARFADVSELRVARITLDTFCDWFDLRPDALTIDVEGSELRVLKGAVATMPSLLWISLHGEVDPHAETPSKVHAFMRERGYADQWLGSQQEHWYRFFKVS